MIRIVKLLFPALVAVTGVLVVLPGLIVGAEYLLSLLLPLNLFECSLLSLGSAILGVLTFFGMVLIQPVPDADDYDEDDMLDELLHDVDEEDTWELEGTALRGRAPSTQPRVGRNAPCPCGSGKKYKLCCGRP